MNPLGAEQMVLLGEICGLHAGQRQLDLASGKGEMLCQYARRFGIHGIGVDMYPPCVDAANARAVELGVEQSVEFVIGDAAAYEPLDSPFDVVSCIGATWIGGGLTGTIDLMCQHVRSDGWLLVGEIYWVETPPPAIEQALGYECADLAGTLDRFDAAHVDLVEMVLANRDTWDRYTTSQWLNVAKWLDANRDHPDAAEVRQRRNESRRFYMEHERRYLGWGVFVLRPM
ncbi:MAG TPA: class I SAM-dependent methyltransferase [Acidimicrobiia bacterium]